MNKVAAKANVGVPRGKISDKTHAETSNEGMKVTSVATNMRKAERNVLLGGGYLTVVKIKIISKSKCKKVHTVSQFQIGNDDYDDQWLMVLNHKEESIVLV